SRRPRPEGRRAGSRGRFTFRETQAPPSYPGSGPWRRRVSSPAGGDENDEMFRLPHGPVAPGFGQGACLLATAGEGGADGRLSVRGAQATLPLVEPRGAGFRQLLRRP